MKKIVLFIILFTGVSVLKAQTLEQGIQQMYYERYQSAENAFHQLLQKDANNSNAWYYLTDDYLLENKTAKANDSLQLAPGNVKNDAWYQVAYGDVLLYEGKKVASATYFTNALNDTKEKDVAILSAIASANLHAQSGDANYAIDLLNKAIKRDKKNAALYVLMGDAYMKLSNGSEAFKAYQKATEVNDHYAQAYHKLGEIFVGQKNPEMYVSYFQKAIVADPAYAPSLYSLYVYEFNRHPEKAMEYYNLYLQKSDPSSANDYNLSDLYFINKQFDKAIQKAVAIVKSEGERVQSRLYKLISYSYAEQKDSAKAFDYMQQYFAKAPDSNKVSKDFLLMGDLYSAVKQNDSLAFTFYDKAVALEKDSLQRVKYFKRFADLAANDKNFNEQAKWLGRYYTSSNLSTNIDLFNWGLAYYRAGEFAAADSVFGMYVAKYPGQSFGYYWQAKSKALEDKDMAQGLAIPAYQKLVEVLDKNPGDANYKKWMVEAYAYVAAYQTNVQKNYPEAISYFQKILQLDPENPDAKKYIAILEKNMQDKGSK